MIVYACRDEAERPGPSWICNSPRAAMCYLIEATWWVLGGCRVEDGYPEDFKMEIMTPAAAFSALFEEFDVVVLAIGPGFPG